MDGKISIKCALTYAIVISSLLILNLMSTWVSVAVLLITLLIQIWMNGGRYNSDKTGIRLLLFSVLFMGLQILYCGIGYSQVHSTLLLRYVGWLLIGILAPWLIMKCDSIKLRRLLFFSFAYLLLNLGYAWLNYQRGVELLGTQYGKTTLIIASLALLLALHSSKLSTKVFGIVFYVLVFYINIEISQRATNMLLFAIVAVLLVLFNRKRTGWIYFTAFVCVVGLIVVYEFQLYIPFFSWVSEFLGSDRIAQRLNTIVYFLETGDILGARGSLTARFQLANMSIETFLSSTESVLIGVGDYRPTTVYSGLRGIGNHNEFIDVFARFGVLGGGLLTAISINQAKSTFALMNINRKQSDKKRLWIQAAIIYFVFIFSNVIGNTISAHEAFAALVLLPVCVRVIEKNSGEKG